MLDLIKPYSDTIIMVCSLMFSISLLPQVLFNYKNKLYEIPYKTSVTTSIFVGISTLVYASNNFWLSVLMGTFTTGIWGFIAIQRYIYRVRS
jgi:hypothetical protein